MSVEQDLAKIARALELARETVSKYTSGKIEATLKDGGDPVTEADIELDKVLRQALLEEGEGWLSEETVDSPERLNKKRVWIVDPIDRDTVAEELQHQRSKGIEQTEADIEQVAQPFFDVIRDIEDIADELGNPANNGQDEIAHDTTGDERLDCGGEGIFDQVADNIREVE